MGCVAELEALTGALDALVAAVSADPGAFGDGESVEALERELSRVEAVTARALGAFESSGSFALDGAANATAWLTSRCHLSRAVARRQLRRGRVLRELPVLAGAFSAGEVTGAHVDLVAAVRSPRTEDALARDEALLVDHARSLRFSDFTKALRYFEQLADPWGTEERAEAQRSRRDVVLTESVGGTWLGQMTLDPIAGAIVAGELSRLEQMLFEAEVAEATRVLGHSPGAGELPRTPAQRRADALVEMASRSRALPAGVRPPAPLFSVLVGYETIAGRLCELEGGGVVTPGTLLPWLERAEFERIVFRPTGRVEVSKKARFFTGATRRAIEVRDRCCTHPTCERPASMCQVDHIVPYAEGGPTTQENGRLLCGFHNRLRGGRPPPGG